MPHQSEEQKDRGWQTEEQKFLDHEYGTDISNNQSTSFFRC